VATRARLSSASSARREDGKVSMNAARVVSWSSIGSSWMRISEPAAARRRRVWGVSVPSVQSHRPRWIAGRHQLEERGRFGSCLSCLVQDEADRLRALELDRTFPCHHYVQPFGCDRPMAASDARPVHRRYRDWIDARRVETGSAAEVREHQHQTHNPKVARKREGWGC